MWIFSGELEAHRNNPTCKSHGLGVEQRWLPKSSVPDDVSMVTARRPLRRSPHPYNRATSIPGSIWWPIFLVYNIMRLQLSVEASTRLMKYL